MKNPSILLLGSGPNLAKLWKICREKGGGGEVYQCSYGSKHEEVEDDRYVKLVVGREVEIIQSLVGEVGAVVNCFDTYIPLHGKLVDAFGVVGPSQKAVNIFRYKSKMHAMMMKRSLGDFRPKAVEADLTEVEAVLDGFSYPVVLKPTVGAKSRGVFVLKSRREVDQALKRIKRHYQQEQIARILEKEVVLIEEYIEGWQIAPVSYVDAKGRLRIVAGVDVLRGPDVGQKHIQNVYRTTPSKMNEKQLRRVQWLLQRLVNESGLTSTFLDPELYWVEDRLLVIEVNVRLGGYRNVLLEEAYGIDVNEMVVDLALGKEIVIFDRKVGSCTAAEVWRDESGVVDTLELPDGYGYKELKLKFKTGERYLAPPEGDVPLASFYIGDDAGNSLEKARQIAEETVVRIRPDESEGDSRA